MSRLTITNSNNDLGPISISDSEHICTFTFKSAVIPENNVTVVNDNSKGRDLSYTKIFYNDCSKNVEIETNNEGIIFNNFAGELKIKTKEAIIPADGFKITYNNNHNLNYTMISYDNGIIVEIQGGMVNINGFGDSVKFGNYCTVTQINLDSEIIIYNHEENRSTLLLKKIV
ncbi:MULTISPECIES: hypothetical protein [unclassified Rickettsia]|uniref:hypothetical protein n=1 Tax=unclassified Rickettsia TaxID=114295 RepID=UPI003132CB79